MKTVTLITKACVLFIYLSFVSCQKSGLQELDRPEIEDETDIFFSSTDPQWAEDVENIAEQLRVFKKANPQADDDELDAYYEIAVKNTLGQRNNSNFRTVSSIDDYLYYKLNEKEKALAKKNKAKAALCMACGQLAIGYAKSNYKSGLVDGNGDAFRHALWNTLMTIDVGSSFAKLWGDTHEAGTKDNPELPMKMDLYNNGVGIAIAKSNPKMNKHKECISKVKSDVRSGRMKIIKNTKLVWSDSAGEK